MTERRPAYSADKPKPKPLTEFGCPCMVYQGQERPCNFNLITHIDPEVKEPQRVWCRGCRQWVIIQVLETAPQVAEAKAIPERSKA